MNKNIKIIIGSVVILYIITIILKLSGIFFLITKLKFLDNKKMTLLLVSW